MDVPAGEAHSTAAPTVLRLARLFPADDPATVAEVIEQFGLWSRREVVPERPRLLLNMISSVDGRATLDGRSGGLSDRADRALFHGLRSAVDAVLVGAGTVRGERYGRIIPDAACRAQRRSRGLSEEPLACIVSGALTLEPTLPLLQEPSTQVAVLTASQANLTATAARVEYVRAAQDGQLDLAAALAALAERFGIQSVLCEGGPHLGLQLMRAGLVDELFLSLSPKLVGGDDHAYKSLRILAGAELEPPVELELLSVLSGGSELFLRYGVSARERVSRETMSSSSLAS
jgi:riboflavin biosynthesis pyrimidine reductase